MADKPKILCVGEDRLRNVAVVDRLRESHEVVEVNDSIDALSRLAKDSYCSVLICSDKITEQVQVGTLLQNDRILAGMPDGLVLLDDNNAVVWANDCVVRWFQQWGGPEDFLGKDFYELFHFPEMLDVVGCPFTAAMLTQRAQTSTFRCDDNRFFQVHAVPIQEKHEGLAARTLIVTIRDVTRETLQQQKLAAIHQAGVELADLTTEEVFNMEVEDRIELLKSNILHFTKDLLNYDVVEIRLLGDGNLMPLLSVGIEEEAAVRPLRASLEANGVTGFVAATGKSYVCQDTLQDGLYIEGCKGAKSSMTVPLIQHEQVIGTFNVESPEPNAFTQSDLQFLEIFSREVAAALNTLELLVAQQTTTAQTSVEAIHREVALPVDEILNDAVNVMELYIGLQPEVATRLQRILKNARDIKQLIHKVGKELAPTEAVPQFAQVPERKLLRGRKVLVVDADESVRIAAHSLLERFGCVVETAHAGGEAVFMVRNVGNEDVYDIIIADVNLPDMTGYDLFVKLKDILEQVPLVLMKGFGYDPGHAIVKARQAGLHAKAVLYKPFRMDQLLEVSEAVIEANEQSLPGHPVSP